MTRALQDFRSLISERVDSFRANRFFEATDAKLITLEHYHRLLLSLFHQVRSSSVTFAIAGARMPENLEAAREYLFKHADEEKTHWRWIVNDLRTTSCSIVPDASNFPGTPGAAYVAFNYYIAESQPIARLAIASFLEGLGAAYSKTYAHKVASFLNLQSPQMSFFLGHADTDIVHAEEIFELIGCCALDMRQWEWMRFAAMTASDLYTQIYNEAAGQCETAKRS